MSLVVVNGALLQCSMGSAPSTLNVLQSPVIIEGKYAATVMDCESMANIPPLGMCTSPANPAVFSATAAASGVLVPMPCIPTPSAGWMCGPAPLLCKMPALTSDGKLMCAYGGCIQIIYPGQTTVQYK